MSASTNNFCAHPALRTISSPLANEVNYKSRNLQQLFTASTGSRKRADSANTNYLSLHPSPLILPDDELAHDPNYPDQSFAAWKIEKDRNAVTSERTTVYIAEYPGAELMMGKLVKSWSRPDQGEAAVR